jgi:hypothetical protein
MEPTGGSKPAVTTSCRCGLRPERSLDDALRMRFDQLIGWAKSGKAGEFYLMDEANIDGLRDDLIKAVREEVVTHGIR